MKPKLAVVYSSKGENCPDTARLVTFLVLRLLGAVNQPIELVKQGTLRADELRLKSAAFIAGEKGHPLLCLLENATGNVIMAAVEPDSAVLVGMLESHGYNITTIAELPDAAEFHGSLRKL